MPFVFGYGSLVDRESVEATITRALAPDDGPRSARLSGHRRAWNVAAHTSVRPDYAFSLVDGTGWEGWIGFLGLERAASASTPGAVVRLTDDELTLLDARERSYERVDVTSQVDPGVSRGSDRRVFTYLPRDDVVAAAEQGGDEVVVMARYLRLVDRGYRALGPQRYAEHLADFPDPAPFGVRELAARPVAIGVPNQALDPAVGPVIRDRYRLG